MEEEETLNWKQKVISLSFFMRCRISILLFFLYLLSEALSKKAENPPLKCFLLYGKPVWKERASSKTSLDPCKSSQQTSVSPSEISFKEMMSSQSQWDTFRLKTAGLDKKGVYKEYQVSTESFLVN